MIRTLRMFACMLLALCACNAAGDRPTEHKLGSTIYGPGPVSAMTPVTLTGTIHIDPQNSSGHASHVCSGAVGCPFLSYSDVVLVWGRRDPYLSATTILFFDSSHTDNTDPIVWEPILGQGAFAYIEGAAPTVVTASVSLASTTAKNTAAGTNALLSTNLGATAAVDQLVENTTHSSRAWVYKLVSGTTFSMSQPFAKVDITSASLPAKSTRGRTRTRSSYCSRSQSTSSASLPSSQTSRAVRPAHRRQRSTSFGYWTQRARTRTRWSSVRTSRWPRS